MARGADRATFDYIIVGAGSAGCVLANRLTASGQHRVLLLEAGGQDRNIWIHIPLGYGKLFANPKVNWLYSTEPEPELNNRRVIQPRGKVMGGSSSINGLLYVRGQHEDYDHWRQLGNAGWSFRDVLPYFRRAEDQERGADEFHGAGGHLKISDVCEPHPLCEAFIEAAQQTGFPRNDDFNGASQEGAGYFQLTSRNGRRWSTAVGYLKEAKRRGNLAVVPNALATRILFSGRRATGVEYRQGGATRTAHANAEVIVAGGAFNSPQLLQLSGLGPAKILQDLGIDIVADMPGVGADLQDHLQIRILYRCSEPITMNDVINNWRDRYSAGLRYLLSRKGLLTIGAGYAGAFLRTRPQLATPDVQFHFLIFSADAAGATLHPFSGFMASVCQLRPDSRGFVRIKSRDPAVPPAIQPRYLSARGDCDCVVDGTDNFPTRYLVNDACVLSGNKPNAYASIYRFEGQASVFATKDGPCHRCLYPEPPPPGLVPSCAEGGVLGILPGLLGVMQATEVIKLILGKGEPLIGRLLLVDSLGMRFRELKLRKNPDCPVCGKNPTVTKLIDYQQFCGIAPEPKAASVNGIPVQNGIPQITAVE
ncbi:MAG: GMC family oxidoreductase N-terminal domain-containing protein, partial [Xanthobacteraceae bacterium]